jgi:radical SAM protein with 4Fe4S-binding SPASM domain
MAASIIPSVPASEGVLPYSGLRTTKRQDLADILPLEMPLALHLETTNRCNFRCTMCPLSFDDWESTVGGIINMSLELHQKIVDDLRALGHGTKLRALKLYGEGEPFIDPFLIEKIKISRPIADRIEITSNGSALTEQKARALLDAGLDYLRVSIYSVDAERHKRVTQSKVPPERIRQNIETFRRLRDEAGLRKPFLYVKMIDTCTEENQRFLELFRPIADEAVIESPMNWNSFEKRDLLGSFYQGVDPSKVKPLTGEPKQVCAYPFYSLVIKANGDVVACCVDWNKNTRVGNVRDNTFAEIWFGEDLREFRRMHFERRKDQNQSCGNCTYLNTLPDNLDHITPERANEILEFGRERGSRRASLPVLP